jgi:triose/dihydroxyacetone kinase / FAD-AMP lyase (cyclizing)
MSKPKQIINDPKQSVDEFIAGLLLQHPNRLQKLQNHHVVLATTPPSDKVQLLSGGGSGHEPSHAGWIGPGMLSGAICGGIFASPSVASILAGIRAAAATQTNQAGILLVVKNYTGDRLNFGMACEMANQEGIPCRLVVVADDCALERTKGITGARGVAGTVLVHKIAGAAAVAGKSLDDIVSIVDHVNGRMGTLGIALDAVTIVGAETINNRLDDKTIEIGLGIHGEAGLKQSTLLTADEMAKEMITTIREFGRTVKQNDGSTNVVPLYEKGDELCVLVNNLGGTSNFEMSILANSCVKFLEKDHGCKVTRLLVGAYMTSFDMHGASVTILNLSGASEGMVSLLDAPCDAPAWNACDVWISGDIRPSGQERPEIVVDSNKKAKVNLPPIQLANFPEVAKTMALKAAASLGEHEALLTKYDLIVGDGDCGITMKRGATEVEKRINDGTIPTDHPVTMFGSLADAVSDSMGGTSGVLIELMFRKMSSTLSGCDSIGMREMSQAFQAGVDAICLYGGATVGSRTMLDALFPAASTLVQSNSLVEASSQAKFGADGTAKMKSALAGRSNYLSEETLEGTPDPGAVAVSIVFEALYSSAP